MVNLAAAGKIKKRVIADSSSDSEGEKPLAKRPKSDDPPAAAAASSSQEAPAPAPAARDVKPNGTSAAAMLAAAMADASSDEDVPMADSSQPVVAPTKPKPAPKPVKPTNGAATNGKAKKRPASSAGGDSDLSDPSPSSSSEDEQPIAKVSSSSKAKPRKAPAKKSKKDESDGDGDGYTEDEEDVKPKPKKPRKSNGASSAGAKTNGEESTKKSKGKAKAAKKEDSDDSDSEAPMAKKPPPKAKAIAKSESESPAKKTKGKKEEEDSVEGSEDEEFQWWKEQKDDDTKKWDSLQHNGVLFPPEYVPLPKKVKMLYDGKPVDLPPESEEVATFFGSMLSTDHVQKPVFCENFFKDFKDVLKDHPPRDGTKIKDFAKCDFQPIFDYFEIEREKKKSLTKDEKKALKTAKDEMEEPFKFCMLDGRKEKVGNFRVEPPSLFRGRGEHPKTGMLKKRIAPEQITINCGENDPIPEPPVGHQWAKVIHNDKASWLAMWKENINGAFKYVFLAAGSSLKGQSDLKKFEKARNLKDHIDRIRRDYNSELTDKTMATRQRATAMYLIDRLALRAGNEKGEDEADTVGCCSLRFEHVTLSPPNTVTFDFLGKDSIRFFQQVQVDEQVFKNLKIFKRDPKDVGDLIFDRLTTTILNKHLGEYMAGLSAKVFRTYNASWTFEQQLEKTPKDASVADKILAYNRANREVAVLCNHQRSVSKTHGAAMEKAFDKIRALKYQHRRLRWQLVNSDGYEKKKHGSYNKEESDLEDDWIEQHEVDLITKEREKITKKFEKDNAKLKEGGDKEMKPKELEERLEAADELKKRLRSERKAKKVDGRGDADKVVTSIKKMQERIAAAKTAATDRDEGKETSLGTSKINYIDPRLTFAWCAKHEVPVEKMFSKTLREKFQWASSTPADWKF